MADVKPFRLRVLERPSNLEQVRAEQEERRRQEETYEPAPPRPVPAPPAADVKYNTAAILREEYLYRQRAEKEAKALKNVEEALRDGAGDYEARPLTQLTAVITIIAALGFLKHHKKSKALLVLWLAPTCLHHAQHTQSLWSLTGENKNILSPSRLIFISLLLYVYRHTTDLANRPEGSRGRRSGHRGRPQARGGSRCGGGEPAGARGGDGAQRAGGGPAAGGGEARSGAPEGAAGEGEGAESTESGQSGARVPLSRPNAPARTRLLSFPRPHCSECFISLMPLSCFRSASARTAQIDSPRSLLPAFPLGALADGGPSSREGS